MDDSFFGLASNVNDDLVELPYDDYDGESDENYDALNDETFGGIDDQASGEDWEQQHEDFAKYAETLKSCESFEMSVGTNDGDGLISLRKTIWAYEEGTNDDGNLAASLTNKSFNDANYSLSYFPPPPPPGLSQIPKKVISVADLERGLIEQNKKSTQASSTLSLSSLPLPPIPDHLPHHLSLPTPPPPSLLPRIQPNDGSPFHLGYQPNMPIGPPPGLQQHIPRPPPGLHHYPPRHLSQQQHHQYHQMMHHPPHLSLQPPRRHMPNHHMMRMSGPPMPPHYMSRPNMMYCGGSGMHPNRPYNFPPPPRNVNPHSYRGNVQNYHQGYYQGNYNNYPSNSSNNYRRMDYNYSNNNQRQLGYWKNGHNNHKMNGARRRSYNNQDEYSGLMSNKEKQWLTNIQMLQLNTGTPYFDDYYYTIYKERKNLLNKENQPFEHYQRSRRNSDRQENLNVMTPKAYTPMQFENSLGKVQCSSVTAPRKMIDTDVVALERDFDVMSASSSRDFRRTRQLLLELEAFYSLFLKAEDLQNTMYHSNLDKFIELKQKQRLRELDAATTPEQKQEILKQLQDESVLPKETCEELLMKIMVGFCLDDKFTSYLTIRKGKTLLLRLLPRLYSEVFTNTLSDVWLKILLSIPTVGRRDAAGDNMLPLLYPSFRKYIQSCDLCNLLKIVSNLTEIPKFDNSRCTPFSFQGKSPMNYIVANKFGISALCTLLVRAEYLLSRNDASESTPKDWLNFIEAWCEVLSAAPQSAVATPIEPLSLLVFNKHCNRIGEPLVNPDKYQLFKKRLIDCN